MKFSLFFIALLIIVLILVILIRSGINFFRIIARRQPLSMKWAIGTGLPLAGLYFLYCFFISIKIGLSHGSQALHDLFPMTCILSFLVIVAIPVAGLTTYHCIRSRKIISIFIAVECLALILSTVGVTPGIRGKLTDGIGNPIQNAYIFHGWARRFLFSNWSFSRFIKTDNAGAFCVPIRFHFQMPFENGLPIVWVKNYFSEELKITIFAPSVHNYCQIDNADSWTDIKEPYKVKIKKRPVPTVILSDLGGDPELYYTSLYELIYHTYIMNSMNSDNEKRELVSVMRDEYKQFLYRYGALPRANVPAEGEIKNWDYWLEQIQEGRTFQEELQRLEHLLAGKQGSALGNDSASSSLITSSGPFIDWPTWGANRYHSRCVEGTSIQTPILRGKFPNMIIGETLFIDINKDSIPDLIFCDKGGNIVAMNGQSRQILWKYQAKAIFVSSFTIDNGLLYGIVDDQQTYVLHALDVHSGQNKWKFVLPGQFSHTGIGSSPVTDEKCVYFGIDKLYALDKKNGTLQWEMSVDGKISGNPVIQGSMLYCGVSIILGKAYLGCIDLSQRRIVWKFPTENFLICSSPAIAKNLIFFGSDDASFYALNLSDGKLKWRYTTGASIRASAAVKDGIVCIASTDGRVYAIETETGHLRWMFFSGAPLHASPCIAGNVVYVGSFDRYLYALKLDDGRKLWDYRLSAAVTEVSTAGPVLAACDFNSLYVLEDKPVDNKP